MNPITEAQTVWIALFESDFSGKVFADKTFSYDVRYWIKRSGDTRVHEAKSTGNRYQMRSYEVFDSEFNSTVMDWNAWTCISIEETYKDYFGCGLKLEVSDPNGDVNVVICFTQVHSTHIKEHLLFSSIMFYLYGLSHEFKNWSEVLSDKDYFNGNLLTIPGFVNITVYNRFCISPYSWNAHNFKFDNEIGF